MKTKVKLVKKCNETWNKFKYLIKLWNNDLSKYHVKYMKIRFDSRVSLPLKQELEMHNVVVIIRYISNDNNRY